MSLNGLHIAAGLAGILAAVLPGPGARAQVMTETGLASGSGLPHVPTAAVMPAGHWRVGYARVDYLSGLKGLNLFSMGYGLSTHVEGYVRLTGEQLGTLSSLPSYGFGVKGQLPFRTGPVSAAGIWFETATTDDAQQSRFFPAKATRGGAGVSFGGYAVNPSVFCGVSSVEGDVSLMAGGGVAVAPWSALRVGVEALRGFAGEKSLIAGVDAALRIAPHIVILANPGYLETTAGRTWTFSFGIAVSTLDVDFRPTAVRLNKDEFQLPSLENIMKESSEEKKP